MTGYNMDRAYEAMLEARYADEDAYLDWCEDKGLDPSDDHWEEWEQEKEARLQDFVEEEWERRREEEMDFVMEDYRE